MYEIETRKHEPKNFFAGDFPTLTETGIAGVALEEHMPITKNAEGKLIPVSAPAEGKELEVTGITAAAAGKGEPIVYYITGEFFADALLVGDEVEMEELKDALRKFSIFLK